MCKLTGSCCAATGSRVSGGEDDISAAVRVCGLDDDDDDDEDEEED